MLFNLTCLASDEDDRIQSQVFYAYTQHEYCNFLRKIISAAQ